MCRVAVSRTPRNRPAPETQDAPAPNAPLYEQLDMPVVKEEIDFDKIFGGADDIEADLDFLEMFNAGEATDLNLPNAGEAVLGQPVEAPLAPAYQAAPQPATIQMPNGMIQGYLPAAPIVAPSNNAVVALQQQQLQYTQAILQQHMLAQAQASASGASMPVNKRGKTAAEIAEQQERIKRRRRESAQRSRQRKSSYMKTLECENHSLKLENERLKKELARVGGRPAPPMFNSVATSGSSADLPSEPFTGTGTTSSDGGLCPVDISGFGTGTAQELMGMVL